VSGVLGETVRLLATHLYLFTLLVLTVWLPGHVALNYLEFFGPASDPTFQSLRIAFFLQAVFDPLVVASIVSALARIKAGLPVPYGAALGEGLRAWPRLVLVRFVIYAVLAFPVGLALTLGGRGAGSAAGGIIALGLGALDHAQADAVLHGAVGVIALVLHGDAGGEPGGQPVQVDERGAADRLRHVLVDLPVGHARVAPFEGDEGV